MSNGYSSFDSVGDDEQQHAIAISSSFEDGVTDILMCTEELRRSFSSREVVVDQERVAQWRDTFDDLIQHQLTTLHRLTLDAAPNDQVRHDLYHHCHQRIAQLVYDVFTKITSRPSGHSQPTQQQLQLPRDVLDFVDVNGQAAIARMVELYIILQGHLKTTTTTSSSITKPAQQSTSNLPSIDQIISAYVSYQRQILRQRSTPALAHLADLRKRRQQQAKQQELRQQQQQQQHGAIHVVEEHDDDDDHGHSKQTAAGSSAGVGDQPHAHAMTAILGAAIALIHPLSQWKDHLPPPPAPPPSITTANDWIVLSSLHRLCDETIHVLHDQAETLTKTVSDWFWDDRQVDDKWIAKTASHEQGDDINFVHQYGHDQHTGMSVAADDLAKLDGLVDEMAFGCQVLARYQGLIAAATANHDTTTNSAMSTIIETELLPVWTWKYATLERYLANQHWQSALEQASPVTIVMGTSIQVPSVVEDAQFVSTRALERAASTQCLQALGTVAHSIANDIWSCCCNNNDDKSRLDGSRSGVYSALIQERGCWCEDESSANGFNNKTGTTTTAAALDNRSRPSSNGFASALLTALDQDLDIREATSNGGGGKAAPATTNITRKKPSSAGHSPAPSSGGFLGLSALTSSLAVVGAINDNNSRQAVQQQEQRLITQLCALNGIHSAVTACGTLVQLIDSLLSGDDEEDEHDDDDGNDDNRNDEKGQSSSLSMIQLAREELSRFQNAYQQLLTEKARAVQEEWCGTSTVVGPHAKNGSVGIGLIRKGRCMEVLRDFFERERYDLDSAEFAKQESDERLQAEIVNPLIDSRLLQQLEKCDAEVVLTLCESICTCIANMIIGCIFEYKKRFTDWGSLLLSKQVRLIRNYMTQQLPAVVAASEQFPKAASLQTVALWERISQIITVLQLEKPADWSAYYQSSSILTTCDLQQALELRVDFSQEAIAAAIHLATTAATKTITN